MRKSANIEKTDRAERSSWSVRALGSQVGMSPIGSYVGGLTSKGQVGVLLWEHRGWILRMASLYKGRLLWPSADCQMVQTIRPETCGASFQTSEGEHQHTFLYPHKEESTIHRRTSVPLSFKKGASYGALSFGRLQDAYLYKKKFRFPPAKQEALHSLEPKAC